MKLVMLLMRTLLFVAMMTTVVVGKEVKCTPGTTFRKECNICRCGDDGYPPLCSQMLCPVWD